MILVTEYFHHDYDIRKGEIIESLEINTKIFDKIYLLNEKPCKLTLGPYVMEVVTGDRLTFKKALEFANKLNTKDIVVVANNDISFEKTNWDYVYELLEDSMTIIALTRWELRHNLMKDPKSIFLKVMEGEDSQDCWMFKTPVMVPPESDFWFGVLGCDCKIARLWSFMGYNLVNPITRLITVHHHFSNSRTTAGVEKYRVGESYFVPWS